LFKKSTDFKSPRQNLQNFLAVVGVEEEESGTSMLPASAVFGKLLL